ncbi:ABC transporter permease [Allorhizocola rhizosphaerae]|uniref:ABC transporter permease n=1 Tax=Allorhizocola rhizosphaerae TaxID=1872709 RepID=UPI000E3C3FDD|nr:ABC transporter permease [Allorhizocola rhizosphaerae]
MTRAKEILRTPTMVTFGALLLIIAAFSIMAPGLFNTPGNFLQLAQNVAILTVVSVGTTFVIITAGVDLSIPSGIVLGEVFAVHALEMVGGLDTQPGEVHIGYVFAALGGAILAGLSIGAINGIVVAYMKVPPLLATLGTLGAGLGVALILQNGVNTSTYALDPIGHGSWIAGVPNLIPIALIIVVAGYVLLHMAVFGRHTFAIGSNPEAARRVGINVERHLLKVYLIGGVTAGFAGFLSVAYFSTTSIGGHSTDNLQAVTAVALGGTSLFGGVGSIIGTLIGVWIPAVLKNGFVINGVQPYWQDVAVGLVLIVAVWLDQLRRRSRNRG